MIISNCLKQQITFRTILISPHKHLISNIRINILLLTGTVCDSTLEDADDCTVFVLPLFKLRLLSKFCDKDEVEFGKEISLSFKLICITCIKLL